MRPRSFLVVLVLLLAAAACASGEPDRTAAGPRVRIVGQKFTEADIVSELYRALLDRAGFTAEVSPIGSRDLYLEPLQKGEVQVAADVLSGTAETLNHRASGDSAAPVASPDVEVALRQLTRLGDDVGLVPLAPTRAEVKNGYAVTRDFAAPAPAAHAQ